MRAEEPEPKVPTHVLRWGTFGSIDLRGPRRTMRVSGRLGSDGKHPAAGRGALLLGFMWMASLPLDTNPFLDDHLIYAVVLIGFAAAHAGDTIGLGGAWARRESSPTSAATTAATTAARS
jgi:hypothetical protein